MDADALGSTPYRLEHGGPEVQRNAPQTHAPPLDRALDQSARVGHAVLEVNDLCISIGGRPLFEPIRFQLRPGECLAVMGPSGTGKSLLLRALAGVPPAGVQVTGEVWLGPARLWPPDSSATQHGKRFRPHVGWVPQHAARCFDPMRTVGAQLLEAAEHSLRLEQQDPLERQHPSSRWAQTFTWQWMREFWLEWRSSTQTSADKTLASKTLASKTLASKTLASRELASKTLASKTLASKTLASRELAQRHAAAWLETLALPPLVAQQKAHTLSGGMARRAALAWSLAAQAPLILADEPTTGADALRLLELIQLMRAVMLQGRAVVLVTHEQGVAKAVASRTLILSHAQTPGARTKPGAGRPEVPDRPPQEPMSFPPDLREALELLRPPSRREPFELRVTGLTCGWPSQERPLARDVSLTLQSGRWYGLTGLSGSGKSTLARVIAGLEPARAGAVVLAKHTGQRSAPADWDVWPSMQQELDPQGPGTIHASAMPRALGHRWLEPERRKKTQKEPPQETRRRDWAHAIRCLGAPEGYGCLIQLVLQEASAVAHPAMTVWEALLETLRTFPPACPDAQRLSGLDTLSVPDTLLLTLLERLGMSTRQHTLVAHLSGGELRRLGLLRALLARPALLILDEPTAGLDARTARQMLGLLQDAVGQDPALQDGQGDRRDAPAVVILSHDLGLLRRCGTLFLLEEGGTTHALQTSALEEARGRLPLLDRLLDAWEVLNP